MNEGDLGRDRASRLAPEPSDERSQTAFQSEQDPSGDEVPFSAQLRRSALGLSVLWLLYSFLGHIVLAFSSVFVSGRESTTGVVHAPPGGIVVSVTGADGAAVIAEGTVSMHLAVLAMCAVVAVIVVNLVKTICSQEWVKRKSKFKLCWKKVKWYNPWTWVKALVCTVYEFVKEVMREICKVFPQSELLWTLVCYVAFLVATA